MTLAEDASGEDRLSGWSTDDDVDTLAALTGPGSGGTLHRLDHAREGRVGGAGRSAGPGPGAHGSGGACT
ncbi:hypothetical protein Sros01_78940 [Streptomyces roseochromogenus]|nr:hypothetical protein Sros01_78940 [Streptomyces roseochromogenus]